MEPPSGLKSGGRDAFAEAVETIEGLGEDPQRSAQALRDYAIAVDVADELRERWEDAGRPTSALGSREQPVGHPLLAELRAQQRHVAELRARLGLDPKARRELGQAGWARGHPRSPDRTLRRTPRLRPLFADADRERPVAP